MYSAEEPERLRGPNHDAAWCDELRSWGYLQDTWDNLQMTLRVGHHPKKYITTTAKPVQIIRDLVTDPNTIVLRGSTFDNADNLAPEFLEEMRRKYEGTRRGREELYSELLEEAEGALWSRQTLDATRVHSVPDMKRIVVAIDPAVTSSETSDETGLVVAGISADDHAFVLRDISGRYSPDGWASKAIGAYRDWQADRIIGEVNNGGDLIAFTLRTIDENVPYKAVHASRGKAARAEPVAALFEQGKAHLVGNMPELEDQLTNWEPLGNERSPDRLDAVVWAITELLLEPQHFAVQSPLRF